MPKGCTLATHNDPSEHRVVNLFLAGDRINKLIENNGLACRMLPCLDLRIPSVKRALARLADEISHPEFGQDLVVESIATFIIVDLCRNFDRGASAETTQGSMPGWRLARLKEMIRADLAKPQNISDLAAACGISERHLIRTFRATMGITLTEYVAGLRIERAKEQLADQGTMIKVVAANCGFQSAAAFSAAFCKATGLSPKDFRNERIRRFR